MKRRTACVLAGDVGGTKTNIGLFTAGKTRPVERASETFSSRDADSLEQIIDQVLERHSVEVRSACFGIAGPVIDGRCRATNLPWVVSEKKLRRRFGWQRVTLMNDLASTAGAIPLLYHREVKALNPIRVDRDSNIGLIAPGTGLGMALLHCSNGRHLAVASEGGHANFAPSDPEEMDLWHFLRAEFGHVSVERVLSGQGLVHIYNWLKTSGRVAGASKLGAQVRESDGAPIIAENAIQGKDPLCEAALGRFCRIIGSVAGDLALTGFTTGGLFLGGGIPPKILPFLKRPGFMEAFTAKGRFEGFMKKIAVRVILNDKAALLGAAGFALSRQP